MSKRLRLSMLVRHMVSAQLSYSCFSCAWKACRNIARDEPASEPMHRRQQRACMTLRAALHMLRRQLVDAPKAVKLILQAADDAGGHLSAKLQYDGFSDLLSSTIEVRNSSTCCQPGY